MELDNLKTIWQKHQAQAVIEQEKGEEEIRLLLQEKTKGTMKGLEMSFAKEIKYGRIVLYIALIYTIIDLWVDLNISSVSYFIFVLLGLVAMEVMYPYYKKKILKIKKNDDSLKQYLQDIISNLNNYIRLGKRLVIYLGLTTYPYLFLTIIISDKPEIFQDFKKAIIAITTIIVVAILLTGLVWIITKYLYKKFYQNHLNNLNSYLKQLEELESEQY